MAKVKTIEDFVSDVDAAISDMENSFLGVREHILGQDVQIRTLETEKAELETRIENAPDATPFIELLERLADHRNWVDGRYAPAIKELGDNVADLCGRILRENL